MNPVRLCFATLAASPITLLLALPGCQAEAPDEPERALVARDIASDPAAPPAGRWRALRETHDGTASAAQRDELERLRAIGYVGGSVREARSGVTVHERGTVYPGLNFYTSGHAAEAILMDLDGAVLHRWGFDFDEVWPDSPDREMLGAQWWRRAQLLPGGELLAIYEGLGIVKIDRDSELIWAQKNGAHHDLEVRPDGDIYVLTREPHVLDTAEGPLPILEDFLSILDAEGNPKRRVSLLRALENSPHRELLFRGRRQRGDLLHTNSVHVLDGRLAERLPEFQRGSVLTSMNALGAIAVLDLEREVIRWARWRPPQGQHDPQILENGNLLFFDNREALQASSVAEIDPASDTLRWEYRGKAGESFFSHSCGAAQRLPNGNTLITESDGGRALEVTADGKIVWEFYNPHRAGQRGEYIATISEMRRVSPRLLDSWLR